jgi:phosphatidate cytidylyltransferase
MRFLFEQSNLTLVLSAVVVILSLATLGYWLLKWLVGQVQNLPKVGNRIQFAWLMTVLFSLAVLYSHTILLLYIWFIAFLALKEYLSITPTRRADRRVLFWAYLALPIQFGLIWFGWFAAFLSFVPLYTFLFLPTMMVMVGETRGFLRANSTLNWGILITVFSLGHLAYLLNLPAIAGAPAGGAGFFLFLMVLTQLNDVAAYLFGKLVNRPKLRLKVSTSRNWASLIGTMGSSALLAWLMAPLLTPFSPEQALVVGVMLAMAGFVGYVTLSAIKVDLQLRDRGTMTAGHGGVLNRIDSLIFTAPLFFYWVYALFYTGRL